MDREWTGVCAPAVDPKVESVDGVEDPKLEEKRKKMREKIQGASLTERKFLLEMCQRNKTKRQVNLGWNPQFPKVAQNFVNDCLRTSLCLQCKPHHIAAYAFFHAAKYLAVDIQQAQREVLYKEFDITFSQLEDINGQMLGLDVWYFSREDIENNSPSKLDGIDIKTEAHLRKSHFTFLKDLCDRLKVNQTTVATAIVLCHGFCIRQSHAKNDSLTIATVCMLLAAKVEDSQRDIKDVIVSSYEIIHKTTLDADQRKFLFHTTKSYNLLFPFRLTVCFIFPFFCI